MQPDRQSTHEVVIIGAGPAGLTAAYQLCKRGKQSVVVEKDDVVGGISRTVQFKDYLFDIGGHRFFTKIDAAKEMWNEILEDDLLHRKRLSRIYYNKKYFYYPIRVLNVLTGLGLWNSSMIVFSYLHSHVFPSKKEETFEEWVTNRFGKRLYRTFFKAYTEKVWGMPCSEIRAEWAAQRIKGLSLMSTVKNALQTNRNSGNGKTVKTLIESFDYPKFGPGMMWKTVSKIINEKGSQLYLDNEVETIMWDQEERKITGVVLKNSGSEQTLFGREFISSMPLRELILKLRPEPPAAVLQAAMDLKYRDFLTVALIVNRAELFPDNWIYVHDPDVRLGRIQNFKNWSPHMVGDKNKTCLGLEYFCSEGDDLWSMGDRDLIELGKRELELIGLVRASEVVDGSVVRMPKAYPSYDSRYRSVLNTIRGFVADIANLHPVGRNGLHRYNNQDHSMYTAMLAVENIHGARHDLWSVNEEPEYNESFK